MVISIGEMMDFLISKSMLKLRIFWKYSLNEHHSLVSLFYYYEFTLPFNIGIRCMW